MSQDLSDDIAGALQALNTPEDTGLALRQATQIARREADEQRPREVARSTEQREERRSDSREVSTDVQDPEDRTDEERAEDVYHGSNVPAARQPKSTNNAPVTWKGEAKKIWADVPPAAQLEIHRRERQMDLTLTQTADQRRYADVMWNAIAPYEVHLRAEGVNHVQAVDYLMKMAHTMRVGTPQAKAKILADMFFAHSVDLNILDQYITAGMEGKPVANDPVLQAIEAKLAPITQFMQQVEQGRQQQAQQVQAGAAQTIQQLLDDPDIGDMVEDVRQDMADLLDLASKRGAILPLRDAAVRAIMAHPEHAATYSQRQLAKQAQQQTDGASRSRRAGASLQNEGAPPEADANESDGSILGDLNASVQILNRRTR